jgi:hypothetical protein
MHASVGMDSLDTCPQLGQVSWQFKIIEVSKDRYLAMDYWPAGLRRLLNALVAYCDHI